MAERSLVDSMTDKWDPEKYEDEYREALMKVIEKKVAAGTKKGSHKKAAAAKATNVVDLMEVLRQSLATAGKSTGKKKKATTKKRSAA